MEDVYDEELGKACTYRGSYSGGMAGSTSSFPQVPSQLPGNFDTGFGLALDHTMSHDDTILGCTRDAAMDDDDNIQVPSGARASDRLLDRRPSARETQDREEGGAGSEGEGAFLAEGSDPAAQQEVRGPDEDQEADGAAEIPASAMDDLVAGAVLASLERALSAPTSLDRFVEPALPCLLFCALSCLFGCAHTLGADSFPDLLLPQL